MVTAEELTVAIRSEGVGETQQDLEGVERAMDQTADSAGDSAEELQGFSESFAGAMQAAVAALAIGVAGLATQIPVLGELFAGFGAILDALFFQVDQLLRPALSGITPVLFNMANGIYETEGAAGDLLGIFTVVATALGSVLAGLLAFSIKTQGVVVTLASIKSALVTAGSALGGLTTATLGAAAAVGAIIGTLGVAVLEVTGVLDAVRNLGEYIGNSLPSLVRSGFVALISAAVGPLTIVGAAILGFVQGVLEGGLSKGIDQAVARAKEAFIIFKTAWKDVLSGVSNVIDSIVSEFVELGSELTTWAGNIASDAYQWGADIVNNIIDGIESAIQGLRDKLSDLSDLSGRINVDTSLGGGGGDGGGPFSGGSAAGPSGGSSAGRAFGSTSTGGPQLDGRQLTESTGRYRSGPAQRRF